MSFRLSRHRMGQTTILATFLALLPTLAVASDLPRIHVPLSASAIQVNGHIDGPEWQHAATIELFDPWHQANMPPQKTQVKLLYTDKMLYVAFVCADKKIVAERTGRDDQVFRDDCVEVFFAVPQESVADAACFEINSRGTVADYLYRHSNWVNYSWQCEGLKVASAIRNEGSPQSHQKPGYVVEMGIPFQALLPALQLGHRPEKLRANFARWDRPDPSRFTIWSDPQLPEPHPHRPERYGWLVFTEK